LRARLPESQKLKKRSVSLSGAQPISHCPQFGAGSKIGSYIVTVSYHVVPGELAEFDFAVAVGINLLQNGASHLGQLVGARLCLKHHPHTSQTSTPAHSQIPNKLYQQGGPKNCTPTFYQQICYNMFSFTWPTSTGSLTSCHAARPSAPVSHAPGLARQIHTGQTVRLSDIDSTCTKNHLVA